MGNIHMSIVDVAYEARLVGEAVRDPADGDGPLLGLIPLGLISQDERPRRLFRRIRLTRSRAGAEGDAASKPTAPVCIARLDDGDRRGLRRIAAGVVIVVAVRVLLTLEEVGGRSS